MPVLLHSWLQRSGCDPLFISCSYVAKIALSAPLSDTPLDMDGTEPELRCCQCTSVPLSASPPRPGMFSVPVLNWHQLSGFLPVDLFAKLQTQTFQIFCSHLVLAKPNQRQSIRENDPSCVAPSAGSAARCVASSPAALILEREN